MAWVRTALSMISFGITLFGVFNNLPDIEGATRASDRTFTPSVAGLVLLGMGTIVMIVACIQHWLQLRQLVAGGAEQGSRWRWRSDRSSRSSASPSTSPSCSRSDPDATPTPDADGSTRDTVSWDGPLAGPAHPSFTLVSLVTVLLIVTVGSLAVVGAAIQGRSIAALEERTIAATTLIIGFVMSSQVDPTRPLLEEMRGLAMRGRLTVDDPDAPRGVPGRATALPAGRRLAELQRRGDRPFCRGQAHPGRWRCAERLRADRQRRAPPRDRGHPGRPPGPVPAIRRARVTTRAAVAGTRRPPRTARWSGASRSASTRGRPA